MPNLIFTVLFLGQICLSFLLFIAVNIPIILFGFIVSLLALLEILKTCPRYGQITQKKSSVKKQKEKSRNKKYNKNTKLITSTSIIMLNIIFKSQFK